MMDGILVSLGFVLLAVAVTFFVFKQKKNFRDDDSPEDKDAQGAISSKEVRIQRCIDDISNTIDNGAQTFVQAERSAVITTVACMGVAVFLLVGGRGRKDILPSPSGGEPIIAFAQDWVFGTFSALAYVCGAATSAIAGYIGIYIATAANRTVAHKISDRRDLDRRPGLQRGFETCMRGGAVMAFGMFSMGAINIFVLTCLFLVHYNTCDNPLDCNQKAVAYCVLSYSLGASTIGILHRIGGSIYMKATDLCRLMLANDPGLAIDLPENDARNPVTVADMVGDVIGDVAGSAADYFTSCSMAICAVLGIMASAINTLEMDRTTPLISHWSLMCLPICVLQSGIVVSIIVYLLTVHKHSPFNPDVCKVPPKAEGGDEPEEMFQQDQLVNNLEDALWSQIVVATLLHAVVMFFQCLIMLPSQFYVDYWAHEGTHQRDSLIVEDWQLAFCAVIGSLMALLGSYVGLYYTSEGSENARIHKGIPVREVYEACQVSKNAAVVTILGLSLGYKSTVAAVFNLAVGFYFAHALGHGLGVALAAMGALGSVCSVTIVTTFGPIAKNAYAMSQMSGMDEDSRKTAEKLATAGNNVLAMSKMYSVTIAGLCATAMIETFALRANVQRANLSIFEPLCFTGLFVGAMLPYLVSSAVIHAVGKAAQQLKDEIQAQFLQHGEQIMCAYMRPDYDACISKATSAALRFLTPIQLILIVTPLSMGLLFGRASACGLAVGCILASFPHAVSCANSGGLWSMTRQLLQTNYFGPSEGYEEWKARLTIAESMDDDDDWDDDDEYTIEDIKRHVELCKPQPAYEAAEVGEHIADPLKDAVAPAMCTLMKQTSIVCCVFGPYFASTRGGYGALGCELSRNCNSDKYPMEGFDILICFAYTIIGIFLSLVWCYKHCFSQYMRRAPEPDAETAADDDVLKRPLLKEEPKSYDSTNWSPGPENPWERSPASVGTAQSGQHGTLDDAFDEEDPPMYAKSTVGDSEFGDSEQ